MQPIESSDNLLLNQPPKYTMNGGFAAFSHGAFHSALYSAGGFRDKQASTMPSLNTSRGRSTPQQTEMQTPATTYDMNFTPLLPSQLLMGSPFQPGSPATFTTSQFQNFSAFAPQNPTLADQSQPTHLNGSLHAPPSMSASMIPAAGTSTSVGPPQFYAASQGGGGALPNFGNNFGPASFTFNAPSGMSRVVYLGNIPAETSVEEILNHVRSGQIESIKILNDKNCAFVSFLDGSSAVHFHSDAMLKKLSIRGQEIKVGWGKPSAVPPTVVTAVQQSGASRNVYLGNLPADITEDEIRDDLERFGPIDMVKLVREKAIAFVHFHSISSALRAVNQLPQEEKWQPPRRVFYGKDRCAYVSKTQQQNAAQFLGISPTYAHMLNAADRDYLSTALAQQSVAAAAVATAAGGVNNVGNRTVYLGNIHPETSTEEICNVVRGGLLHHIRYIPDKHICFVTFIDPTSAASFYTMSNIQGLMIHNRRLKIGWGKHSGPLPPAIALAVSAGASRNVYIGNIDETFNEDRLKQDFSEFGETELVNMLREKSCSFVNFTNIANAIKAIEAVKGKEEYKRCKVNFGKDRCGNPPRPIHSNHQEQFAAGFSGLNFHDGVTSPGGAINMHLRNTDHTTNGFSQGASIITRPSQTSVGQPLSNFNVSGNHPFGMYLNSVPIASGQHPHVLAPHQQSRSTASSGSGYGPGPVFGVGPYQRNGNLEIPSQYAHQYPVHAASNSFNAPPTGSYTTVGGLLAPVNLGAAARVQHSRAISLPAYSQTPFGQQQMQQHDQQQQQQNPTKLSAFNTTGAGLGFSTGSTMDGFGLAIQGDGPLSRWAEEDVTS